MLGTSCELNILMMLKGFSQESRGAFDKPRLWQWHALQVLNSARGELVFSMNMSRDQSCPCHVIRGVLSTYRREGVDWNHSGYSIPYGSIGLAGNPFIASYHILPHQVVFSIPAVTSLVKKLSLYMPLFTLSLALAAWLTCSRTCRTNDDHREIALFGNSRYYFVPTQGKSNVS